VSTQARAKRAAKVSTRRAKKFNKRQEHSQEERDGSEMEDSEEDTPKPVRVLTEFWGPNVMGKRRFAQRLFQVLFADGTKLTLVAEDLLHEFPEPFEKNPFYDEVLREWRATHATPLRPA